MDQGTIIDDNKGDCVGKQKHVEPQGQIVDSPAIGIRASCTAAAALTTFINKGLGPCKHGNFPIRYPCPQQWTRHAICICSLRFQVYATTHNMTAYTPKYVSEILAHEHQISMLAIGPSTTTNGKLRQSSQHPTPVL